MANAIGETYVGNIIVPKAKIIWGVDGVVLLPKEIDILQDTNSGNFADINIIK